MKNNMKDKLLKLVDACIKDESMYTHTYLENKSYRGINEREEKTNTGYVSDVTFKEKSVYGNKNYPIDLNPFNTKEDRCSITIGFGNEPQISITPILKGDREKQNIITHSVPSTTKNYFGRKISIKLNVIVVKQEYHYQLKCGSFSYILEDSIVKELYNTITKTRKEILKQKEVKEIDSRLAKYNVS